jgi:hypothetical protein
MSNALRTPVRDKPAIVIYWAPWESSHRALLETWRAPCGAPFDVETRNCMEHVAEVLADKISSYPCAVVIDIYGNKRRAPFAAPWNLSQLTSAIPLDP